MVVNLPVVNIYEIWFQNAAIGITLFIIIAGMNILVRAIFSIVQTQNVQQHALVVEHCITASTILPILPYQRHEIARVKRYHHDVIPTYVTAEFRSHFRLSRETFENLCTRNKTADCAAFRKPTGPPLGPTKTVLTYLWYIAIGWCYR